MFGYWIWDLEHDIMSHCLKERGKWWANHFFRNREVDDLYAEIRAMSPLEAIKAISK